MGLKEPSVTIANCVLVLLDHISVSSDLPVAEEGTSLISPELLQDHCVVIGADNQLSQVNVIPAGIEGDLIGPHFPRGGVPRHPETGLRGLGRLQVPGSFVR